MVVFFIDIVCLLGGGGGVEEDFQLDLVPLLSQLTAKQTKKNRCIV